MTYEEISLVIQERQRQTNEAILKEKINLWNRYMNGEVSVVQAFPTIFSDEGRIQSLRNNYYNFINSLGVGYASQYQVYRDDSQELLDIREKFIKEMNTQIDILRSRWHTVDLNPTMPDTVKNQIKNEVHAEAEEWRQKIIAVGGTPIPANMDNYVSNYYKDLLKKYTEPENIPIDSYNQNPTNLGRRLSKFYKSFSGTDAIASLIFPNQKPIVMGEVSTLSYSIYRHKTPVNTLGRISPKGFTKGTRTVAGSIIFTMLDKHWVNEVRETLKDIFGNINKLKADELPPFDIVITFANEYGASSFYTIYGVTILEEGQVVSIEDAVTENVCQFMARDIDLTTANTLMPVSGRTDFRENDYETLPRFTINNLISDDAYQRAQQARSNLLPELKTPPTDIGVYNGGIIYIDPYTGNEVIIRPDGDVEVTEPLQKDEAGSVEFRIKFVSEISTGSKLLSGIPINYRLYARYNKDTSGQRINLKEGTTTDGTCVVTVPINNPNIGGSDESLAVTLYCDYKVDNGNWVTGKNAGIHSILKANRTQNISITIPIADNINVVKTTTLDTLWVPVPYPHDATNVYDLERIGVKITPTFPEFSENYYVRWTVICKRSYDVPYSQNHLYKRSDINKNTEIDWETVLYSKIGNSGESNVAQGYTEWYLFSNYGSNEMDSVLDGTKIGWRQQGGIVSYLREIIVRPYRGQNETIVNSKIKSCNFEINITAEVFSDKSFNSGKLKNKVGRTIEYIVSIIGEELWNYTT